MRKRVSKIIAFTLSTILMLTGFTNLSFSAGTVLVTDAEEPLGASAACEDHTLGAFNGVPACVNANGDLHCCENNFPDEEFRRYLSTMTVGGSIGYYEEEICPTTLQVENRDIYSLQGIEFFSELKHLRCYSNNITELNLSKNIELVTLGCLNNNITSLDVSMCPKLKELDIRNNSIPSGKLILGDKPVLTKLLCSNNPIMVLDASRCPALTNLECDRCQLIELDVSNCTALTRLDCGSNQLTELDLSNNTALTTLYCYANQLAELDVSNNTALTTLYCTSNQLTELDLSNNTALTSLNCTSNQLAELDLSNNTALTVLECTSNQLMELDLSNNTALTMLYCSSNQLAELDVSGCIALTTMSCSYNRRKLELIPKGNQWTADMGELVSPPNFERITSFSQGIFDSETGLVTFDSKPSQFTYTYDVGKDGKTMTVTVNLTDHVHTGITHHEAVAATCHETGTVEYWTCSSDKCEGKYYSDADCTTEISTITTPIDADNHDGGTEIKNAVDATCSTGGYTGDTYCLGCGKKLADGETIPATGAHINAVGEWESDGDNHWQICDNCDTEFNKALHEGGEATCSARAVCTVCGAEYGELEPDNHGNTEIRDAVAATEEAEGYTGDKWCLDCNKMIEEGTVVPKLDHTHAMVKTEAKPATCEEDGNIEYYTCSKCGKKYNDEAGTRELTDEEIIIRATGHNYGTDWKSDTNSHWHECTCSKRSDEGAHTFGEWTVTKEATETADGSRERECTVCGYIQSEVINATGGFTDDPDDSDSPQTGDNSNLFLWLALMAMGGCGIIVTAAARKRCGCK